ncbi:hypothetical protein [Aeoliella sp. SH292]|uniref:hypothetical protein n=1 Tax=Aeoliella sp. SH292 TaxID=3454464 RepID=UPI003F9840A0
MSLSNIFCRFALYWLMTLITDIQSYIAYGSVGASTVRGLRTKGVVDACRKALKQTDLRKFATSSEARFQECLDIETARIKRAIPSTARHWGVARKVLNIFLRGCLYNIYLNQHFKLSKAEHLFEIPLDSISAKAIKLNSDWENTPRWRGVKYVTPDVSHRYQELAADIAKQRNICRVHLDALFWGGR